MEATIYTHPEAPQQELDGVKRQLDKRSIDYVVYEGSKPHYSDCNNPVVEIKHDDQGKHKVSTFLEERSLFMFLFYKFDYKRD